MAQVVQDAMTAVLSGRAPRGAGLAELGPLFPSPSGSGIGGMARYLAGLPPTGPLPKRGTERGNAYIAARRRIERQQAGTRRTDPELVRRLRREGSRRATALNVAAAKSRGLDMRLTGWFQVSRDRRYRTIPSDVQGEPRYLNPSEWEGFQAEDTRPAVNLWARNQRWAASEQLLTTRGSRKRLRMKSLGPTSTAVRSVSTDD